MYDCQVWKKKCLTPLIKQLQALFSLEPKKQHMNNTIMLWLVFIGVCFFKSLFFAQ